MFSLAIHISAEFYILADRSPRRLKFVLIANLKCTFLRLNLLNGLALWLLLDLACCVRVRERNASTADSDRGDKRNSIGFLFSIVRTSRPAKRFFPPLNLKQPRGRRRREPRSIFHHLQASALYSLCTIKRGKGSSVRKLYSWSPLRSRLHFLDG